jgi:hypothetical protein
MLFLSENQKQMRWFLILAAREDDRLRFYLRRLDKYAFQLGKNGGFTSRFFSGLADLG